MVFMSTLGTLPKMIIDDGKLQKRKTQIVLGDGDVEHPFIDQ